MKRRRLLSFILTAAIFAGVMGMGAATRAAAAGFIDVKDSDWYNETVSVVANTGIIAGNPDGSFNPEGTLTWAHTVTFTTRIAQYMAGEKVYGKEDQTANSKWYQVYVDYALANRFISSVPSDPDMPITRAEAAVIFAKLLGNSAEVNFIPEGYFTDVPATGAHDAIYLLARAGIVNGVSNTGDHAVYGCNSNFTRAQAATLVARLAGLVKPTEILVMPATPDFVRYNIPTSMEVGKTYNYTTLCNDDHNLRTTGKAVVTEYKTITSDADHPAKDGYEWRIATFRLTFSDENAYYYGMMWSFDVEDYYNVVRFDESAKAVSSSENSSAYSYSVIHNNESAEVMIVSTTLAQGWDDGNVYSLTMRYSCQVPVGYDGIVIGLHSPEIVWPNGKYIYNIFDASRWMLFRLN